MPRILLRGGTSVEDHDDVVLASREVGVEYDTGIAKLGDGVSTWDELDPINKSEWTQDIADAVAAIEASDVDSVNGRTGTVTGLAEQSDLTTEVNARIAAVAAEAALARNADNLTSGTVADARIPATIARDAEVTAAVAAEAAARDAAIAAAVAGLLDIRGTYNASGNTFPASGGSGSAGAVVKGDAWIISTGGTLGGAAVSAGDMVFAVVDTPGQTASNWDILELNVGYTPVNAATLTTDGDLLTRASGVPARMTRAALAADSAFSGTYAPLTDTPSLEELERQAVVSASIAATTTVRLGSVNLDQRIPALTLAFSNAVTADNTNYWTVELLRYRGASVVRIAAKTTRISDGEAIVADQGWNFDAVSWHPINRYLRRGDVLALKFTKSGSATTLTDVTAALRYEPNLVPTVVDTFTRADNASSMGSTEVGALPWTALLNTWGISGNQAYNSVSPGRGYAVVQIGTPDCTVSAKIGTVAVSALCGRMSANGLDGYTHNATTLFRSDNNTLTTLATFSTLVDGDTVSLSFSGSTIKMFVNGVQVASVTDSTYLTSDRMGLRMTSSTTAKVDDFALVA